MLFNSFVFLLAFPTIFAAYYLCPIKWRSWLLLLISYAVYMNWVPIYALILLWVTPDDLYRRSLYIPQQPQEQAKNDRRRNFDLAAAAFLQILQFYKWHRIRYIDVPPPAHRNKYNALGRSHRHILLFISGIRISGGRILQTDRLRTQPPGLCTVHFIFSANSFGSYQQGEGPAAANQKSQNFRCRQSDTGVETVVMGLVSKKSC